MGKHPRGTGFTPEDPGASANRRLGIVLLREAPPVPTLP